MKFCFASLVLGLSSLTLSLCDLEANRPSPRLTLQQPEYSSSNGRHPKSSISPPAHLIKPTPSTPTLLRRAQSGDPWTTNEDTRLIKLREERKPWSEIDKLFPERTYLALRKRYYLLTRDTSKPKGKLNHWTPEEDELLLWLVDGEGESYEDIAELMPERTQNAISSHYNHLRRGFPAPEKYVKRFTAEEDKLLLDLAETGKPWSERVKYFENRSIASLQKRLGRIGTALKQERHWWTPEEEDLLVEALDASLTWDEISELLERDKQAVRVRAKELEKQGRIDSVLVAKGSHYADADFELMHDSLKKGMAWKDIARNHFPGRPVESMRKLYYKYQKKKQRSMI